MGFTEANKELTAIAPLVPEKFKALGHQGWTAMPVTGSPQWYSLVTSLILGVGIGCLAQPQLVVRFMTVESSKQLNRGVFIGCFFPDYNGRCYLSCRCIKQSFLLEDRRSRLLRKSIQDIDKIIPYFINKAMPDWFAALFMLCILSASMSTLSSQFHTMGASVGSDIYGTYKPRSRGKLTNVIRLGVLFSILVSYIICYMLPHDIIARGTSIFMGICAAAFLPAYFCALYWKKATKQGVMASLWVGTLGSAFALIFLHQKEAAAMGICKFLFGKDVLIETYPFPVIDPILFALPLSILAIVVVSLLTGQKQVVNK